MIKHTHKISFSLSARENCVLIVVFNTHTRTNSFFMVKKERKSTAHKEEKKRKKGIKTKSAFIILSNKYFCLIDYLVFCIY